MRFWVAVLLWGAAATGGAPASSITVLEPMKNPIGPSIVALGAPASSVSAERTGLPAAAGSSIVALGAAVPAVSYEMSAAIAPEPVPPRSDPATSPMVIRGGLAGDAFVRAEPARTIAPRPVAAGNAPAPDESAPAEPGVVPASEQR